MEDLRSAQETEPENGQKLLNYAHEELEPRYFSTLEHIERIIEYAQSLGVSDTLLEKAGSRIAIVADRLSLTPVQTVLFCLLFGQYNNDSIDPKDMSQLFSCSPISLLRYTNDLEELVKKKLIEAKPRRDKTVYRIPMEVVKTLSKQDVFVPESRKNLNIDEFFYILESLFEQLGEEQISCSLLHDDIIELTESNKQLLFCQRVMSYNFSKENTILLICFCHLFVNNFDNNVGFHDFDFLFDKRSKARLVYRAFQAGDHPLIEAKFIENTNDDGFVNRESFRLTDSAKKELLAELDIKEFQVKAKKGLIAWDTLTVKKLFYNEKERERINELISLLKKDNFTAIQDRLAEKNMRRGFACLFSGQPGTGKTETVYQIAIETQRNLMQVDLASIKNMYVGETEKHIKAVFDNYRKAVAAAETAPILFFNEADGIFGKRIEFSAMSRAVDRMENTMQNIILQELETLDGILIATTNLTKNLDGAFERRFLYKIEFEKPDSPSRAFIWQSMLENLSGEEARELAEQFELSGGQIENAARRYTIGGVLKNRPPDKIELFSFCREELEGLEEGGKKIGF
ncbi:MAG: ATP-binding protein [Spirochaetales bacterium]|jgi:hypothetical protein|nr:ATP-binding protein [Spirochaetales bacterium]